MSVVVMSGLDGRSARRDAMRERPNVTNLKGGSVTKKRSKIQQRYDETPKRRGPRKAKGVRIRYVEEDERGGGWPRSPPMAAHCMQQTSSITSASATLSAGG